MPYIDGSSNSNLGPTPRLNNELSKRTDTQTKPVVNVASLTQSEADFANKVVKSKVENLLELYQRLDTYISEIVLHHEPNKIKDTIEKAKDTVDELEYREDKFREFQKTLGEFTIGSRRFTPTVEDSSFSNIQNQASLEKAQDKLNQNKDIILEEQGLTLPKSILKQLRDVLDNENIEEVKEGLISSYEEHQDELRSNKYLNDLKARQETLKEIESFVTRNDPLKRIANDLGEHKGLSYLERITLLNELELISSKHPQIDQMREAVPGYQDKVKLFINNIKEMLDIPNIEEIIHQAARNFIAKDAQGNLIPFVLGAFNEVKANKTLLDNGFTIHELAVEQVEDKTIIMDSSCNDLLDDIDLKKPSEAKVLLKNRNLLKNSNPNDTVHRLAGCTDSHLLFYDEELGQIVSHKRKKTNDENRIFIRQADGKFTKCEIDCRANREDYGEIYIEHKINASSIVKKNLGNCADLQEFENKNGKELTQIEKLMVVAKSHGVKPCLMFPTNELLNSEGVIDSSNPLRIKLAKLILDIESKRPDLGQLTILDQDTHNIRSTLLSPIK